MEILNGSQILIKTLINEGVDTIFGYPGGTIMPLYDELYNYREAINHLLVRHEQGAVHAAEGYSRASGKVAVCMATAGPGATNLITGIADAYADSTPIVCITAQVPHDKLGSNFFQEADIISLTIPVTKWNYQITKPEEIQETLSKAFYIAQKGRPGPVLLSITRDSQTGTANYYPNKVFKFEFPCFKRFEIDESTISKVNEWINSSEKPLIIAGQGITLSSAEKELLQLAERGGIPVATTLMGVSAFPTLHEFFAGNVGMHGNLAPNFMTQKSDLILALGMRFSDRVTGDVTKYAPLAKIVHIDIDKSEFNKSVKSHIQLHGDLLQILKRVLPGIRYKEREEWIEFMKKYKKIEQEKVVDKLFKKEEKEGISMAQVIDAISRKCDGEQVIVTDVGQHQMFSARYAKFKRGRSFITSGGLGTMGFGLPAAMGAKIGVPERQVVAVTGDGGFQMTMQELGTIAQSGIDLKIVILNNSFLGMVRQWQELFFERRYSSTEMKNPDFTTIARAYGIKASMVTSKKDMEIHIDKMFNHKGAYLLEIAVNKEENVFPMVPAGASLDDIMY